MKRLPLGSWWVLALCSCGSGKDLVLEDLPPHPSQRVGPVDEPPVVTPPRTRTVSPPPSTGGDVTGSGTTAKGVDAALVEAWRSSRDAGVVFQQTMAMSNGTSSVSSRVQVLGDQSRRDDLGADGQMIQTTLTLPDDVIIIDHAARTWTALGGRLDQIAKDASSWYFQKDFKGLKRWTLVGQEVVDGMLCDVYEQGNAEGAGGGQVRRSEKVWFARDLDGFALRYESSSFLGLGVTVVRSQVGKAAVKSSDLEVPSGYTRLTPGN